MIGDGKELEHVERGLACTIDQIEMSDAILYVAGTYVNNDLGGLSIELF